jgi:type II secretory pathway pseudopilin PulG
MKSLFASRRRKQHSESGYVLMTLILIMAMMAIAAGVIVSSITFEIKRDREQEMIHRGVQYSRAIRAYYKKFSRYPAKIEDLENTNQMRFLRKRYKDPLTGKDFRLLHYGEAKMSMNALGGAGIAGANSINANGTLGNAGGLGQTSQFGGNSAFGATTSNGAFGQNSQSSNQAATTDPGQPGSPSADGNAPNPPGGGASGFGSGIGSNSGDKLSNTTFGGAPIVGVASTSKDKTIREFDKKKKYDEWQFVYDPTFDRGFLITTPYQPSLQQAMMGMQNNTNLNGQNNSGQSSSGFGNGFGNSQSPMQNNPTSPVGGYGAPNPGQPANPPQQQ